MIFAHRLINNSKKILVHKEPSKKVLKDIIENIAQ